jgi:transcriptional regulator with XRE-family HTH domain
VESVDSLSTLSLDGDPLRAGRLVDVSTKPNWEAALERAGFVDQRSGHGASWSQLAKKLGVHTTTLSNMASGKAATDPELIRRVAGELGLDPRVVSEWAGQARSERAVFEPHRDADLMTKDERAAINRLIGLITKERKRGQSWTLGQSGPEEVEQTGGGVTPPTQLHPPVRESDQRAARKGRLELGEDGQ